METENEIDYKSEYLQLAARVRRTSQKMMGAIGAKNYDRLLYYVAALCTETSGIIQQSKMLDESTDVNRYSLTTLIVDTSSPIDSESPSEED